MSLKCEQHQEIFTSLPLKSALAPDRDAGDVATLMRACLVNNRRSSSEKKPEPSKTISSSFQLKAFVMAKHLAQLIIAGAQVVGRAFAQAVRQEIRMSQEAAKRNATRSKENSYKGSFSCNDDVMLFVDATATAAENVRSGLTLDEAKQILNVPDDSDREAIEKSFKHLFEVNDKSKGGSFYLQSKVVWESKEVWDQRVQVISSSFRLSERRSA